MYFDELVNDPETTWIRLASQAADEEFKWANHDTKIAPLQHSQFIGVADFWHVPDRRARYRQYVKVFSQRWETLAAAYQKRALFDFQRASRTLIQERKNP